MGSALSQVEPLSEAAVAAFETVSVRPSPAGRPSVEIDPASGTFSARAITVRQLAAWAYGVDRSTISGGPSWLGTETYDIRAQLSFLTTGPPMRTAEAIKEPFRRLLFGYFGLQAHMEQQRLYILEAEPTGRGLMISEGSAAEPSEQPLPQLRLDGTELHGSDVDLDDLAKFLGEHLGRPVLNHTQLVGTYDFSLSMPDDASDIEALIGVLRRQLGLGLRWVLVDAAVIDSANAEPPAERSREVSSVLDSG
jgi:uncharacterized protein (TIGR03435 family)